MRKILWNDWTRKLFIGVCAVFSGTIFLYIKQNIHDLEATNFEDKFEEFDHPFALLFCVYSTQMVFSTIAILLNGPIRRQLIAGISKWLCCLKHDSEERQGLLSNGSQQIGSGAIGNSESLQDSPSIAFAPIIASITNPEEEQKGFIKLFTEGDLSLKWTNYLPPAIFMLISTSFVYYAFGATYPATIVMFRAVSLAAAGLFCSPLMCAKLRVRRRYSIIQWLAVTIMICAIAHSAFYDWTTSNKSEQRNDISYLVTVPLLISAHVGIALADTYDEKFLHEKRGIPLVMCFVEATFGTIFYMVILPLLYLVPDPLYPTTQDGVMENALNAFTQMKNNPKILYFVLGLAGSETIWMWARAFITRHTSALTKTMIDSLQLVFVRYLTPELYVDSNETWQTTVFTGIVFILGLAVFYFGEKSACSLHIVE